jgi:hypothetical protein
VKSLLLLLLLAAAPARAAEPAQPVAEAQGHFKRGVELYEDADYPGALVEFRRAYELVPNYRVLYNLGRVSAQLHDYAAAIRHYRQYLTDGAGQVVGSRRQEVEEELRKLATRVGQLRVVVDLPGAEIAVDDVVIGRAPLEGTIPVNAGKRRVVVSAPRLPPVARVVEVAGEDTVVVALALRPATPAPPPEAAAPVVRAREPRPVAHRKVWPLAVSWSATGLCAAGAAVAGVMALRASHELRDLRDSYPVTYDELEAAQRRTRRSALLADGLLVGTALLTGVSLYLTISGPRETSVALGPDGVRLRGRF